MIDWPLIFRLANGFALVAWLILILGPRPEAVLTALRDGAVGLLCLLYAVCLVLLMSWDGGGADFTSIEGVRAIFAEDGGLTLGWVHYLAFDLFVGLWIARDSDRIALSRFVQAPILAATFLFGPFGLLIFLLVRRWHTARTVA